MTATGLPVRNHLTVSAFAFFGKPLKRIRGVKDLTHGLCQGFTLFKCHGTSNGIGSLAHLAGALLATASGAQLLYVPYKGSAPAVADVMAGQLDMAFPTILQASQVRSGRLRALAVTSLRRSAVLPEVPTISESGIPGYEINQWNGLLAPPTMPVALAARLSADINEVLALPEVKARLGADGSEAVGTSPAVFAALLRAEIEKWKRLSKDAGIRID
jgi:tripartite-type tricarboxylate transporter receptor subunit TctC